MTWHNLPCLPTLPALFAACPHGWAELTLVSHAGNPTSDPPQDADNSVELGRVYGVEHSDLYLIDDLAYEISGDPPIGLPSDCTVPVRFTHGASACMICKQVKADGDDWACSKPGCDGVYMVTVKSELTWGPDKAIPYFTSEDAPVYGQIGEPPPQSGHGDMWQQVISNYHLASTPVLDIFRKRREMGLAKYGTPLQAGNGRNPLRDLMDETLDRIVYIEQAITEVPGRSASLRTEQDNDVELVEVLLGMQGFEDTGEQCRAAYLRSIGSGGSDPRREGMSEADMLEDLTEPE